jgi:acetyltransferase-like isoleucine patch superfamily enzyme/glycosyltransferase involved in cell wall biosynthesis
MKPNLPRTHGEPEMNKPTSDIDVSVIVIGRNEGLRLQRCLCAVQAADWAGLAHEVIYVDSRSADDSVAVARAIGAGVMVLDDAAPCAARARNLGWRQARGHYLLFLDGDTELHPGFVRRALDTLADARLCAVWGHRRESKPAQSVYTRVLDLDWVYPAGRSLYFGGDVLVRRTALSEVDGFDPGLKAGEEPELCARLRAAGWEIEHIDAPMTQHDLAVDTLRAYWLRAYRSGIAYAEVAHRMRKLGDSLWQHESQRDFRHGILYLLAPWLLLAAIALDPAVAAVLCALAAGVLLRTAYRSAWKAPGQWQLCLLYALHTHFQKIPALFGQLRWRDATRRNAVIALVDYKQDGPGCSQRGKALLARVLAPLAWCQRRIVERGLRAWHLARLQEATGRTVDPSNLVLGHVELHGTCNIRMGRGAMLYPGVYLETQGCGSITLGDGVVLSRGVHIVAFDCVALGDGCMVGEYAGIRDANHRTDGLSVRDSGHRSAPIHIGQNVWIGRGASVLQGVHLDDHCVVGANAVVTRSVSSGATVGGVPARKLHATGRDHAANSPQISIAPAALHTP